MSNSKLPVFPKKGGGVTFATSPPAFILEGYKVKNTIMHRYAEFLNN